MAGGAQGRRRPRQPRRGAIRGGVRHVRPRRRQPQPWTGAQLRAGGGQRIRVGADPRPPPARRHHRPRHRAGRRRHRRPPPVGEHARGQDRRPLDSGRPARHHRPGDPRRGVRGVVAGGRRRRTHARIQRGLPRRDALGAAGQSGGGARVGVGDPRREGEPPARRLHPRPGAADARVPPAPHRRHRHRVAGVRADRGGRPAHAARHRRGARRAHGRGHRAGLRVGLRPLHHHPGGIRAAGLRGRRHHLRPPDPARRHPDLRRPGRGDAIGRARRRRRSGRGSDRQDPAVTHGKPACRRRAVGQKLRGRAVRAGGPGRRGHRRGRGVRRREPQLGSAA